MLVLVNEHDEVVGKATKEAAHAGNGMLHRAITILLLNEKNEILITRRSDQKPLWNNCWDAACSTHPEEGESYLECAKRRMPQEIGICPEVEEKFAFVYHELFEDKGAEWEYCMTLVGQYSGEIFPVPAEVSDYKWISVENFLAQKNHPEITPWLRIAVEKFLEL